MTLFSPAGFPGTARGVSIPEKGFLRVLAGVLGRASGVTGSVFGILRPDQGVPIDAEGVAFRGRGVRDFPVRGFGLPVKRIPRMKKARPLFRVDGSVDTAGAV